MADLNRIGGKIDAPTLAHILKYYGRFGDRQAQIAAYERRQARRARGVNNLTHASHQQITKLAQAGLIGSQPAPLTGYDGPPVDEVSVSGTPFGQGGPKVSPMVAAAPVATQGPAMAGGSPFAINPDSPLQQMLATPPRPRKRIRPANIYG